MERFRKMSQINKEDLNEFDEEKEEEGDEFDEEGYSPLPKGGR
jgi:hypothetical protein